VGFIANGAPRGVVNPAARVILSGEIASGRELLHV
jgi:hypothetical protein